MSAHVLATITVTNPESLAAYREKAGEALARHGGKILAAAPAPDALEGGPAPSAAAVLCFPDAGSARAWIEDQNLASIHALRRDAGHSTLLLLPES